MSPSRRFSVQEPALLLPWLLASVPGMNRTRAKDLLRHGGISVNGVAATRHDVTLHTGDEVSIGGSDPTAAGTVRSAFSLPFPILFEDEWVVAIDKPAGLLSIGSDQDRERTAHRILGQRAKANRDGDGRVWVVHRLDRETSGILLFAKTELAKHALQSQWASTQKEYDAIVEGLPTPAEGTLRDWLLEDAKGSLAVRIARHGQRGAQEAITHYKVAQPGQRRSQLRLRIETGRKHQIRVQLAHFGHPVVGDPRYGSGAPAKRMALHAGRLTFAHPSTGAPIELDSPCPTDLLKLVS